MEPADPSNTIDLLSAVNDLSNAELYPTSSMPELHPVAESHGDSIAVLPQLRNILSATAMMSMVLTSHLSLNIADPKLVSLMRQKATITQELNISQTSIKSRLKTFRERKDVEYGEDIPPNTSIVDWFLARIEEWGKSANMQVFSDPEPGGKVAIAMAGKILVLDIEFQVDHTDDDVNISLKSLKSSHASPLDAPATAASTISAVDASLDTFLTAVIEEYLEELLRKESRRDPILIAKLGRHMKDYLRYIMKLDHLAQREIEGGSRWFTEGDDLSSVAQLIVPKEATTVAQHLGLPRAPLDILLLRGHALPIPYLNTPFLSFLVYLSSRSYLSLLRSSPPLHPETRSETDICGSSLRSYFSKHPPLNGSVIATLSLGPSSHPRHFAAPHLRPTFLLIPEVDSTSGDIEFQSLDHILPMDNGSDAWTLDFGADGVVMSQGRMWEIQLLLGLAQNDAMPMMSFGYTGSWVDLLVKSDISHETYEATYLSPSSAHPPLQLRLTAPQEPGFIIRKIRVQSLREIWAILEIVKEQAWYNNLLTSCQWSAAGAIDTSPDLMNGEKPNVNNLLNGSYTPKRIPVTVYIEPHIPPPLFDATIPLHRIHPGVIMVFPSKEAASPLVNLSIKPDTSSPYGVEVTVNGFPVAGTWAEVVRRGGGLTLPGRFWMTPKDVENQAPSAAQSLMSL